MILIGFIGSKKFFRNNFAKRRNNYCAVCFLFYTPHVNPSRAFS